MQQLGHRSQWYCTAVTFARKASGSLFDCTCGTVYNSVLVLKQFGKLYRYLFLFYGVFFSCLCGTLYKSVRMHFAVCGVRENLLREFHDWLPHPLSPHCPSALIQPRLEQTNKQLAIRLISALWATKCHFPHCSEATCFKGLPSIRGCGTSEQKVLPIIEIPRESFFFSPAAVSIFSIANIKSFHVTVSVVVHYLILIFDLGLN